MSGRTQPWRRAWPALRVELGFELEAPVAGAAAVVCAEGAVLMLTQYWRVLGGRRTRL